jgi:hypothetical protein
MTHQIADDVEISVPMEKHVCMVYAQHLLAQVKCIVTEIWLTLLMTPQTADSVETSVQWLILKNLLFGWLIFLVVLMEDA